MTCIRQPSQGPTFGIKGGAAGGGYSQVVPMEDFNLHLTGDIHAVGAAHNLLAAAIDNRLAKEARWSTDYPGQGPLPRRRVHRLDAQAPGKAGHRVGKALRPERRGQGAHVPPRTSTPTRSSGGAWSTSPTRRCATSSSAWARKTDGSPARRPAMTSPSPPRSWPPWPCAATWPTCASAWAASSSARATGQHAHKNEVAPITAEDLNVAGAMTVLLKDAIMPNLMQTLAGSPAFVHCGPVRQHRPGQQLDHRRQDRPPAGRLCGHRVRLWRRLRHGKVHEPQVPLQRPGAQLRGAGLHRPRPQDARRRPQGRRRASRWTRPTPRRTWSCWRRACPTCCSTSRTRSSSACRSWWPSTASRTTPTPRST